MRLWFLLLSCALLTFSVSGCTVFDSGGMSSFLSKDKESAYKKEKEDPKEEQIDEALFEIMRLEKACIRKTLQDNHG